MVPAMPDLPSDYLFVLYGRDGSNGCCGGPINLLPNHPTVQALLLDGSSCSVRPLIVGSHMHL